MHGIADLWHNRAFDRVGASLRRAVELNPSNALGLAAAAFSAAGRDDEARTAVAELVSANPHYRRAALARYLPFKHEEDLAFLLGLLEKAGLPE